MLQPSIYKIVSKLYIPVELQILELGKMRNLLLSPRTSQTTLVHNAGWKSFDNKRNHGIKD